MAEAAKSSAPWWRGLSPLVPLSARPVWARYGGAIVATLLGWLARNALTASFGPTYLPFSCFYPAVAIAAWYGGFGPGLSSVLLSAFLADLSFFEPVGQLQVNDPVSLAVYAFASLLIVAAIAGMHRARERLVAALARREAAERSMTEARDLLATTLASIGDGVLVTDVYGKVTLLNPEGERLTGWKRADAQGHPIAEVFRIVNQDTRRTVESPVDCVLRDGVVVGLANHTLLIARDGSETPIDDSAAPVMHPGGPLLGVVLVFRDVAAPRRAEENRARLASIVETTGDAVFSKALDGTIRTWNAAAERMFGWRAEEIVGKSITVLVPPDRLEEEAGIIDRLRAGRGTDRLETVRLSKDGRRIPVEVTVSVLRDSEGGVVGASKIIRDLTAVREAQAALAKERDLLSVTLSSIGDAVIATDAAGRVTLVNGVACGLTGWSEEEARGRPLTDVFRVVNEVSRREVENPALRAMKEGTVVGLANHTVLLSKSGDERPIDDSAAPIRSRTGDVIGSVLIFRDVTARRRLEADLRQRVQDLAAANRQKSEFMATLAHELRNPLAPIRNCVEILNRKGPAEPVLATARNVIERQVEQMARLLDDLLDVNRIGHQKLTLRKERLTLASVVEVAVETARPWIAAGGHSLDVDLPAEPVVLEGDRSRLAQVFANLLNNAAKYTLPGGRISLAATCAGEHVDVSVRDTGVGIEASVLPRLFELFSQAPGARERAPGGLGIGLALAKGLAELHGGTIEARSEGPGKGSEFIVRLPVVAEPAGASPPGLEPEGAVAAGWRILVVDDNRDAADSMTTLLETMGADVRVAYDGDSALSAADAFRPGLVFVDLGMPVVDGYEFARRVRRVPWGRDMRLVAVTGWGAEEERRRSREAGIDEHLLKPVTAGQIERILRKRAGP